MPFGITASITAGLVSAGVGSATAGILAAGIVSAGTGALIGGATAALTGGNIGKGALYGGIGGAVTGGGGALFTNLAPATAGSLGLSSASFGLNAGQLGDATNVGSALSGAGEGALAGLPTDAAIDSIGSNIGSTTGNAVSGVGSNIGSFLGNAPSAVTSGAASAAPAAGGSWLSQAAGYIADNPLKAAQLGNTALSVYDAVANNKNVDVGRNAANAKNATGFNDKLPQYTMTNTATPYAGDWYKYGYSPQAPLYSAQPTPVQAYARGGQVHGYAQGGPTIPSMPMPPLAGMGSQPVSAGGKVNPLDTHGGFAIGKAIGEKLKATGQLNKLDNKDHALEVGKQLGSKLMSGMFKGDGMVPGQGGGQDDLVDAKLSVDEYVIPADVVADLGDGSSQAGGKALDTMVSQIRKQKNVKGFPPKAKAPLAYIGKHV